jgi:hypothetical protein
MAIQKEPTITINGVALTPPQAMTVRVAVTSYVKDMNEPGALGEDNLGEALRTGYLHRGREVLNLMIGVPGE